MCKKLIKKLNIDYSKNKSKIKQNNYKNKFIFNKKLNVFFIHEFINKTGFFRIIRVKKVYLVHKKIFY